MDKKTALVIYHRCDFDGLCSYAIARRAFLDMGYEVTGHPFSYNDNEPSDEEFQKHDAVVIVDVCLSVAAMRTLAAEAKDTGRKVIWIDHHRSSIKDSEEYGFSTLEGSRDADGNGACESAWGYFNPWKAFPKAVKLLALYDVYNKEELDWENIVMPFQYAMRQKYGLDADAFCRDFTDLCDNPKTVPALIERGRYIYEYARSSGSHGVDIYGFPVTVAGTHKGVCCLTNQFGSLAFERRLERDGATIAVCVNRCPDGNFRIAMYGNEGNTLNLGEYLKTHYRTGGGHFNAAGATMSPEQFLRLLEKNAV